MANSNSNQRLIYFLSIVDVLTHYGVKKAAAKVTKLRCTKYRASNSVKIFDCQISLSAGSKDGEIRVKCGRDLNGRARAVRKKVGHIFLGSSMPKYGKHFLTQKGGVHFFLRSSTQKVGTYFFFGAGRKKVGLNFFLEQDA